MDESKTLILGDLHLGRSCSIGRPAEGKSLNSRIQDQIDLLDWVYSQCVLDENLRTIVVTGDVYQDFRPHPAIIGIFMRWLKKCQRIGIQVHIIMGNHDIVRSGQYVISALDLVSELEMESAFVHKSIDRIDIGQYTIVFVPFRDKRMYEVKTKEEGLAKLEQELDICTKIPSDKIKVCIGHLAIEGSIAVGDEISDQLNEMYVPPDMFKFFDMVWMGHIHNPQVLQ